MLGIPARMESFRSFGITLVHSHGADLTLIGRPPVKNCFA